MLRFSYIKSSTQARVLRESAFLPSLCYATVSVVPQTDLTWQFHPNQPGLVKRALNGPESVNTSYTCDTMICQNPATPKAYERVIS